MNWNEKHHIHLHPLIISVKYNQQGEIILMPRNILIKVHIMRPSKVSNLVLSFFQINYHSLFSIHMYLQTKSRLDTCESKLI
jgi:hypothetical protein